ncbi:DUF1254 domain-containing protein [Parasedimentitalea psychrophila]|uniref:DUF1254 domain-containing protein n=1 Tax=Parasedimentitalea psychrophila TaxID=2997337 RepID=A0A9Y2KYA0_9RHOB|nr:DUF1254 domain-containing protein [Parasedimentitalea psychrophila]WIY23374.1 DUF1254 domain-containing protein [Parasedimentitalea psychrophila]
MKLRHHFLTATALGCALFTLPVLADPVTVTVDSFVRAETDMTMKRYTDIGGFGKFAHIRQPTPLDEQNVIRMNHDTLYSFGIFDLTTPVTITKPESDRWQSMMFVTQDHSIPPAIYEAGSYTLTQEEIGTRYVTVAFRTLVNANEPADIKQANALQDQITVTQADIGTLDIPDWDEVSLTKVREAVNVLAATLTDTSRMLGDKDELDPIQHLLGTAMGWGGNPKKDAMYFSIVPENNDGKQNYELIVKDIPVDGFASVTVYNSKGFMEINDLGVNAINNLTAKPSADGGAVIHFGGCEDGRENCIPTTPGWNYLVRLYQPQEVVLDKSWTFPDATPIE